MNSSSDKGCQPIKVAVETISLSVVLFGSLYFGWSGMAAEMALAIVAGAIAFALANLDKFSHIKGAGFEAKLKDQFNAMVEKETEPLVSVESEEYIRPELSKLDEKTRKVLQALQHPEYTWRYLAGVSKETGLSQSEVNESLKYLVENGLARQSRGKYGPIWNLTWDGRQMSAIIDFSGTKPTSSI